MGFSRLRAISSVLIFALGMSPFLIGCDDEEQEAQPIEVKIRVKALESGAGPDGSDRPIEGVRFLIDGVVRGFTNAQGERVITITEGEEGDVITFEIQERKGYRLANPKEKTSKVTLKPNLSMDLTFKLVKDVPPVPPKPIQNFILVKGAEASVPILHQDLTSPSDEPLEIGVTDAEGNAIGSSRRRPATN